MPLRNKCKCGNPPFDYRDYDTAALGLDHHCADVRIDTCKACGKKRLKYLIEEEHYTKSGRWRRVPISKRKAGSLTADQARKTVESARWCFVGGSYYDGKIGKIKRPGRIGAGQ